MLTTDETSVPLTNQAEYRAARHNIPLAALEYILTYRRRIRRTGVTFYFLGRRDVPAADRQVSWVSQLEGTVVLMSGDGAILTVYRHRKALPTIRRKMKYRLPLPTKDYRKGTSR